MFFSKQLEITLSELKMNVEKWHRGEFDFD